MKSCGCVRYFAIYPCGHELSTWHHCNTAKAKNLFQRGPPTPCATATEQRVPPDLQDTCGSTCLTKPFLCSHCGADKQVSWRCSQCQHLRDQNTLVWDLCSCRVMRCAELVLGKPGEALCKACEAGACCSTKLSVDERREVPVSARLLSWKCHSCGRANRTPADAMVCGAAGCGHRRCGQCRALFDCTCFCGCANCFVSGGPKVCEWCVVTCKGENGKP